MQAMNISNRRTCPPGIPAEDFRPERWYYSDFIFKFKIIWKFLNFIQPMAVSYVRRLNIRLNDNTNSKLLIGYIGFCRGLAILRATHTVRGSRKAAVRVGIERDWLAASFQGVLERVEGRPQPSTSRAVVVGRRGGPRGGLPWRL